MVMQRDMTAGTNTKKPKGNFENAIHVFVHEVSKPRTKSVGTFMYSTYWNIPHLPGGGGDSNICLAGSIVCSLFVFGWENACATALILISVIGIPLCRRTRHFLGNRVGDELLHYASCRVEPQDSCSSGTGISMPVSRGIRAGLQR